MAPPCPSHLPTPLMKYCRAASRRRPVVPWNKCPANPLGDESVAKGAVGGQRHRENPLNLPSFATNRYSYRSARAEGAQPAAGAGIGGQLCHTRDGRLPRERGSHDAQARLAQGHRCGRGCELPADLRIKSHARHEAELDQPLGFLIELPVPGSAAPSAAQTSVTAARKSSRFRAEDDSMIDLFGASTAKSVVPSSHSLDASSRPCQARFDEPGHCLVTVIGLP